LSRKRRAYDPRAKTIVSVATRKKALLLRGTDRSTGSPSTQRRTTTAWMRSMDRVTRSGGAEGTCGHGARLSKKGAPGTASIARVKNVMSSRLHPPQAAAPAGVEFCEERLRRFQPYARKRGKRSLDHGWGWDYCCSFLDEGESTSS